MKKRREGFKSAADILPGLIKQIKGPTPIEQRLINAASLSAEYPDLRTLVYQHSTLCQVFLPYRDPGPDVLNWTRSNGLVDLRLISGEAKHPSGEWVRVPLPFGPKCRLVLMHINQLAIVEKSPRLEMEDSLTAFVRRVLKLDPKGRNLKMVKEQLRRLATSSIRLGANTADHTRAVTRKLEIVTEFDVWFPKDERQRVLWPSYVELSAEYFASLQQHAVPLNEAHIAALSHSAMALDIYTWLAQRLHRIPPNKPAFVPWTALHAQFGQGYAQIKKFREVFRTALKQVLALYQSADVTDDDETNRRPAKLLLKGNEMQWREPAATGLTLRHSAPPVPPRLFPVTSGKP